MIFEDHAQSGSRRRRLLILSSVLALTVGLMGVGGAPASAEQIDIFNPDAVLGAIGEVVEGPAPVSIEHSQLTVESSIASRSARDSTADGLTVSSPVDQDALDAASEAEARISGDIRISAPFATEVLTQTDDTIVAATENDATALYIQPTAQGVRLMTVLGDRSAPDAFTYELSVPEGTTARTTDDGGLSLHDAEGRSAGRIAAPWAKDANGVALPTSYEWTDGTLTQHIDLSDSRIAFPVVADPAWDYTVGWLIETKTVSSVRSLLKTCFNCYFPVAGAPVGFPTYNQFLPLMVGPAPGLGIAWNFNCYMDGESYYNEGGGMAWFSYQFRSAAGHVDGLGSSIEFAFNPAWKPSNPSKKYTELIVYAFIQNENPMGIGQPAYTAGAWYNWGAFAGQLRAA